MTMIIRAERVPLVPQVRLGRRPRPRTIALIAAWVNSRMGQGRGAVIVLRAKNEIRLTYSRKARRPQRGRCGNTPPWTRATFKLARGVPIVLLVNIDRGKSMVVSLVLKVSTGRSVRSPSAGPAAACSLAPRAPPRVILVKIVLLVSI